MKFLMEQIINSNYVKYDRMTKIINSAFKGSKSNNLNIYVDIYSILKPLYHNKNYDIDDYSLITSCIINLVAHYRDFFRTRYNVETKFFLVYSKNCPHINNQFVSQYNSKNIYAFNTNKLVNDMISNNIDLLNILCPYLPDIYFINGTFETGVIIYDLICRNDINNIGSPHMIITRDAYNYQLVPMRDNIIILRPKKSNGNDFSFYINNNNVLLYYLMSRKSTNNDNIKSLMPGVLSLLMTLSSVKERNIPIITNIRSAINIVKDAIDNNKLLNGYNNIINIWNSINNSKLNTTKIEFENRFKAIDIQFQHLIYINTPEAKSIKLLDLVDDNNIRSINNKYFKINPLDLNRL